MTEVINKVLGTLKNGLLPPCTAALSALQLWGKHQVRLATDFLKRHYPALLVATVLILLPVWLQQATLAINFSSNHCPAADSTQVQQAQAKLAKDIERINKS
ncbi:MAG: hypothetical protein HC896_06995 [Bacteroidales bacterium]|nr:hypothetical protein [Bacteroidales bacterium]